MKLAILSDVHANLPALNAVLADARGRGAERVISLGDLVGYGPEPAEVLQVAYARIDHFVLGNHDAVIARQLDPAVFNPAARQMIAWTGRQLNAKAAAFFKGLPYVLRGPRFRCCHGNPASPAAFGYVLEDEHALEAWQATAEVFLFIGHSHVPGLFVRGRSGRPHWLSPQDFGCEEGKRYIVNVGSVGLPRDGSATASYCLFDDAAGDVFFRQVPFDLETCRQALRRTAAPTPLPHYLKLADRGQPAPLREVLDFHPLSREQVRGRPVVEADLDRAVRAVRRWRRSAAVLLALLVVLLLAAGLAWQHLRPADLVLPAAHAAALPAPSCGDGCLPAPGPAGAVTRKTPLADWSLRLSDPDRQRVVVRAAAPAAPALFSLWSEVPLPLQLESRPVQAATGMRFQVVASCRQGDAFEGHAEIALLQRGPDGIDRALVHCPLGKLSAERWKACRRSAPADGLDADGTVRWVLRGQFRGELLVREADLRRSR